MKKILLFTLFLANFPLFAKVLPPNYNFSFDSLNSLLPNSSVKEAQQIFGESSLNYKEGSSTVEMFKVKADFYHLTVFIQHQSGIIQDTYIKLPSYFLHDVFHQSLINRYQKQQEYYLEDEHAIYRWSNAKLEMTYSSTCTITCFPIYLSLTNSSFKQKSLLEHFRNQTWEE